MTEAGGSPYIRQQSRDPHGKTIFNIQDELRLPLINCNAPLRKIKNKTECSYNCNENY